MNLNLHIFQLFTKFLWEFYASLLIFAPFISLE